MIERHCNSWSCGVLLLVFSVTAQLGVKAQPDTLWVPTFGTLQPYAVIYEPVSMEPGSKRIGRFAFDTSKVAVRMDYKRGTPSGVYRAYYPDGSPLIFAVYGWASLHGDWTEYGEDGSITLKGQYRQGLRDGVWAFRKDGIVGHYKEGKKHGKWQYYENGKPVRSEKWRHGEMKRTRNFGLY